MHITVHLALLASVVFFAFVVGFVLRLIQVRYLRSQVLELEKEKMQDHSELLQLQKKLSEMELRSNSQAATPVVPLKEKDSSKPEEGKGKRATQ